MVGDWVFANPTMRGKQPYWPDNLMKRYIRPVARANGIFKLDVLNDGSSESVRHRAVPNQGFVWKLEAEGR